MVGNALDKEGCILLFCAMLGYELLFKMEAMMSLASGAMIELDGTMGEYLFLTGSLG